jgi:hypothetical protein
MKEPARDVRRIPLGLKVTAEAKRRIDAAARASGRTQSAEVEFRIERSFALDDLLKALNATDEQLTEKDLEARLRRRGHKAVGSPWGTIWLPPGHPDNQPSGFIPDEEEGQQP